MVEGRHAPHHAAAGEGSPTHFCSVSHTNPGNLDRAAGRVFVGGGWELGEVAITCPP